MKIHKDFSLKNFNSFGIEAKAKYFVEVSQISELQQALSFADHNHKFILGGGSNILLVNDINALVIHINLKGINILSEDDQSVEIAVMAGENWHQLVLWSLDRGYGGLENLSLIPGNTGTAPVQNIGAYGVELKDSFVQCRALDTTTLEERTFSKNDCHFGYRDSYFKNDGKNRFVITSVTFKLTKKNHVLHTQYGSIEQELSSQGISTPTIKDVSNAVIAIRNSKLPNPKEIGNSGSFFKNPVVDKKTFSKFIALHPEAPYYKMSEESYKIPAGWLIEQCGFKGKRFGDAGVHAKQALVLVNYGRATGQEILALSEKIITSVYDTFGITIVPEVNIIK